MNWFCLLAFIVLKSFQSTDLVIGTNIKLSAERRLDDILIYINDNVPEQGGKTLENIQELFTEASIALYKATKNFRKGEFGTSFGEVHIRVPMSWVVQGEPMTWQQCVKSEIQIVTRTMNGNTDVPFTKQIGGCGKPGHFSRFSESYINEEGNKRVKGKEIMVEFLKLRYGVYSEKPYRNVLYTYDGFKFVQSSCPEHVNWKTNKSPIECSDRDNTCNYTIKSNQKHKYSVMFDSKTSTSDFLCNNDTMPHNKLAYNLHNVMCNKKSVTSVILEHEDFKTNAVETRYKNPNFRIVKASIRKVVLLLDTSGSMYPVIDATKKALIYFIKYAIEDDAQVGIVTFSNVANIHSKLITINANNKDILVEKVKKLIVFGATNMGDGLLKAVEVLGGDIRTEDKLFGTIILLSDGENNENTTIDYHEAINNVIIKGVVVYTLAYGKISDPELNRLSNYSGGMFIFAKITSSESELFSKFYIQKSCDASEKRIVKMKEGNLLIDTMSSSVNFTSMDKFIGSNTVVNVEFKGNIDKVVIKLEDPLGKKFDGVKSSSKNNITIIIFEIPGKPEAGMYKFVFLPVRDDRRYRRSVFSVPLKFEISGMPINSVYNPAGFLSTTNIDVVEDTSSVKATVDLSNVELSKFEEVKVIMKMTYPNMTSSTWKLTDDGWGDDAIEGDGIFTRAIFAKSFTQKGLYQFQGNVKLVDTVNRVTIKRTVEMESLRVGSLSKKPLMDKIPPSSVQTVHITSKDKDKKVINILFTAPGDDSMTGNINKYNVKIICKHKVQIKTFFKNSNPYDHVVLKLELNDCEVDTSIQLSVRGVDLAGNYGLWSTLIYVNWDN